MAVAYLLSRRHEVVVFEAEDRLGGHSHTVQVPSGQGPVAVDTGFIVYNERTYPNFCRLIDQLGVATEESDMSFSFRNEATGLEYAVPELRRLLAVPANLLRPRFWRMLRQILRFYREAPRFLETAEGDESLELQEYLAREGYDEAFCEDHLFPVAESIWSGNRRQLGAFPARAFLRFSRNHGLLSLNDRPKWRTIRGGSIRYVEKLTASYRDAVRLSTPVRAVRRDEFGVVIVTDAAGEERFDEVVLACHADQSLRLLADPTPLEQEILGAFPYAENRTTLHTDPGLMPRRRAAWSAWNYHRRPDDTSTVALTYSMNLLQNLPGPTPWLVTLNRDEAIADEHVHGRYLYAHPQYDARGVSLQGRHDELNGQNHTWYCGAYWGYGFHEDGLASALRVARRFGEEL